MIDTAAPPAPAEAVAPGQSLQPPLFDLLARSWRLEAAVHSISMDNAGKTAGFALADGRIALIPLDDAESPLVRMRVEFDSGRSTIRPREKPVASPILTRPVAGSAPFLVPSASLGFIAAGCEGRLTRVTPRGQAIPLGRDDAPLSAIASDGKGRIAIAREDRTDLHDEDGMPRQARVVTEGFASAIAFAPDGQSLAVQQDSGLLIWQPRQGSQTHATSGTGSGGLVISADGEWIAGTGDGGLWLLRRRDGQIARIGKFRAPPLSISFSAGENAVFAAGAFRVAGWSLGTPPFASESDGALRSGRTGLVLIERVAAHPTRPLVAFGTADGAVSVTRIGEVGEMPLRHGDGAAVSALVWSACGTHLAMGTTAGDAAIVTLPAQIFK